MNLDRLPSKKFSWVDLRAFVKYLPVDSALSRETNPDWWITPEITFLREIELGMRMATWIHSSDGSKGRNRPERIPITYAERVNMNAEKPDAMPFDELNAWLGGPFAALNN